MSRFATTFSRRAGTDARVARRPCHDPIAPRPGRRRARPPSRHPARPRPAVRPRMAISRRTRRSAWQELPRDADDVLHRCRPTAPRVPMAAAIRGGVAAGFGRAACPVDSCPGPALAPFRAPRSRPARDVRRLLEHRRARHHRLADRHVRPARGFRSRVRDPGGRQYARSRRDIDRYDTYRGGATGYVDACDAAAQGGDACREHGRIAASQASRRASTRNASPASDGRRAACRPCFATSGNRPAHGKRPDPYAGRAAARRTSAAPACAAPARRGQHRHTRSTRSAAAHGRYARYTRLVRRSGHVDRNGEHAARRAAGPAGVDWTSHLSHRRVTDVPDAFAH